MPKMRIFPRMFRSKLTWHGYHTINKANPLTVCNAEDATDLTQNTITDAGTVERNCNNEKRTKLLLTAYYKGGYLI